jgi:rod shape-determining protein MreC
VLAFLKRYRELIAIGVLLVFPLITYLAHSKHGRDLTMVDRAVLFVTTPVERGVSAVVCWTLSTWHGYVGLREVQQENLTLRAENLKLKQAVAQMSEAQAENERLRRMVSFAESAPAPLLTAPIIGEGPTLNLLTLKIGKGTADGVVKGLAVVSSDGVVGRVLTAGTHSADVLLIADTNSAVPVRAQRSRARAKVMGQGARDSALSLRPFSLVQALRTDDIEDGDILVTAGTDGVFPKGLVVGRVTGVVRPAHGMFLSAEVVPAVNVAKVEEVFVLPRLPGREELPEASSLQSPP